MSFCRLPVIRYNEHFVPWNLHRVNLERLPLLDLGRREDSQWFNTHLGVSFSDKERIARDDPTRKNPSLDLMGLKDPLCTAFLVAYEDKQSIIALHCTEGGGIDTVFFVTGIRLDLPAHTIVIDAYVLPLKVALLTVLGGALQSIIPSMTQIPISSQDVVIWKKALPAMIERCRSWDHKLNCSYIEEGKIPLSTEHSQIPICDCGRGQDNEAFKKKPEWKVFAPYVTRIALSPLFAVSYLESVASVQNAKAAPNIRDLSRCAKCGKSGEKQGTKLLSCSRCKSVTYCSKACQTADWKRHKPTCAV